MRPPSRHWLALEPHWNAVSIYDGPDVFATQFAKLPAGIGVLFAATWCLSEVSNGGFHQFFLNSTGVLAPEAVDAFEALGLSHWADVVREAIAFFGPNYPRERGARLAMLPSPSGATRRDWDPFYGLDDRLYGLLRVEGKAYGAAADAFAEKLSADAAPR